jgi:hypothetical protein
MEGRGAVDWRIKPLDPSNAAFVGPALTAHAYPADFFGVAGAVTGLEHLALGSPADWSDSTRTPLATARPGAGFHLVLEEDGVYLNYQAAPVPEPSLFFYLSWVLFGGAMRRRRGPSGRHPGATIEGARS